MDDSDLEFEDEWEAVEQGAHAASAADRQLGDITINLADGSAAEAAAGTKQRSRSGRTYTKQEREDAVLVHRVHTLCLLAHALVHDEAATSSELQALLVSMIPADLLDAASAAASSEDPSAAAWLPALLRWFHETFTLLTAEQQQQLLQQHQKSANGTNGDSRKRGQSPSSTGQLQLQQHEQILGLEQRFEPAQQQLLSCVRARCGVAAQLCMLLVAMLRGVGFLTRSVWSLESLPFRPAAVEALQKSKGAGSMKRQGTANVAAAAEGTECAKAAGQAHQPSNSIPGRKPSNQKRSWSLANAAAAAAANAANGAAANLCDETAPKARRPRHSSSSKGGRGRSHAPPAPEQQNYAGLAKATGQSSKRKGDEEFELQLAMALASTAAEAESKQVAAAGGTAAAINRAAPAAAGGTSPTADSRVLLNCSSSSKPINCSLQPSGKTARSQPSLPSLIIKGASPAALRKAVQQSSNKTPSGWLWQPQPGLVPRVWAEVYVGSSASGRWLHVDGVLGCWDQPGVVEAATARGQPLGYVVACQGGAAKDVARRYAANFTVNMKWRQETWWMATMTSLRSSTAHLPPQLAAKMMSQAYSTAATYAPQDAATAMQPVSQGLQPQLQQPQQIGSVQGQQVAQQQLQHASPGPPQISPFAAAAAGGAAAAATNIAASTSITDPTAAAAAATADPSDAALRAQREEAELAARAASQAAGPPTSIEGFKGHPVYVLERHITKYQSLVRGASKLGLHRGEPYYFRKDLHDLHTWERWRREGRDVKEEELNQPAKIVKKRLMSAATAAAGDGVWSLGLGSSSSHGGGGSGRGRGRGPSGWGAWQRNSNNSSANGTQGLTAPGSEQPAAAAEDAHVQHESATGNVTTAAAAAAGGSSNQNSTNNAADGDSDDTVKLYGYWQTVEWTPPAAADGRIPRNERGNVEVPPFAKSLPAGTKHISLPGLAPICRSLGIDFAPALVGFEVQGGRMVPKIDGIVICEEHEQAVIDRCMQREADKAAAETARLEREAAEAWRRLLLNMWTRLQLQRKYGGSAAVTADNGNTDAAMLDPQPQSQSQPAAAAAAKAAESSKGRSKTRAKSIVDSLHAAEQQQNAAASDDTTAAADGSRSKCQQMAARAQGGRAPFSCRSRRVREFGCLSGGVGAAATSQAQPGGQQALQLEQQQEQQQQLPTGQHALDGVEVEEF